MFFKSVWDLLTWYAHFWYSRTTPKATAIGIMHGFKKKILNGDFLICFLSFNFFGGIFTGVKESLSKAKIITTLS